MATLREIRTRIASIKSTQQITKAMKMVAAAKLRKAQEKILATRPYAAKLQEVVTHLVTRTESAKHPFLQQRAVESVLFIIVTADRGLCGAFNANIIREAVAKMESYSSKNVSVMVLGKKGYEFLSRRNYNLFAHQINFFNQLSFKDATAVVEKIVPAFLSGQFDRIEIMYNEFVSAIRQQIRLECILPVLAEEESEKTSDLVDYLYEPAKEEILSAIIPRQLNIQMWKILLESNASEQGARMTAMESATDNAEELINTLTLHYNRARQAAITKEISEIVGGAEALKEH